MRRKFALLGEFEKREGELLINAGTALGWILTEESEGADIVITTDDDPALIAVEQAQKDGWEDDTFMILRKGGSRQRDQIARAIEFVKSRVVLDVRVMPHKLAGVVRLFKAMERAVAASSPQ